MASTIYTIGHSTHGPDEFLHLLDSFGIETLADVRRFPGSRKYPHFGQTQLRELLSDHGLRYAYFEDLGGRRKVVEGSRNTAWRNKSFQGYADYMETAEFQAARARLKELAAASTTAMMCAEVLWWRCHRSLIADTLKKDGWDVIHIMGEAKSQAHRYTSPARLVDGELVYR